MYDQDFIFRECGFDWIPGYIHRDLLFNVSYDVGSGDIKLYFLDSVKTFLYKVTRAGISAQYAALSVGADPTPLIRYLGIRFDPNQIQIDTVEGDVYYLYIEPADRAQYIQFMRSVALKYDMRIATILQCINKINARHVTALSEAHSKRSVSMVRIGLDAGRSCKLYSRPYLHRNGFLLPDHARQFLCRLHRCNTEALPQYLSHLWVSIDLFTERLVVATQFHQLLHQD